MSGVLCLDREYIANNSILLEVKYYVIQFLVACEEACSSPPQTTSRTFNLSPSTIASRFRTSSSISHVALT